MDIMTEFIPMLWMQTDLPINNTSNYSKDLETYDSKDQPGETSKLVAAKHHHLI